MPRFTEVEVVEVWERVRLVSRIGRLVAAAADGGQILVSSSMVSMIDATEFEFGEPINAQLKSIPGVHVLRPLARLSPVVESWA